MTRRVADKRFQAVFRHVFLLGFSFIMFYPVLWWIGASLKTVPELSLPTLFPEKPMWSNFTDGWNALPKYTFTYFYLNSAKLNMTTTVLTVISSSLVAFGFARLQFPLKKLWFSLLLMTIMLPGQVVLIPQYSMFHQFDWINTYWPFIVPSATGGAFFIFLLVQFIRGLPRELDESAKLDGCNWWGIYWRIVMPLTRPALVTVLIFSFLWSWDDYFGPLIYLNSIDKYTVPLALGMFIDTQSATAWGQLLAMSLVSILPQVFVFFLAQRHFLEGIATTGLKG
ncbi:sugar ABC transporter permease [Paenibacillus cisolokensis]|jgi:ABC-type sugar transport system, permease component|uniref:Sugar ABC transporter permease n=1 Tax=Paenibacillus cisolokensis TaxID=1658519 RepID=A0ABQ4NA03_9BACL|nr:carbohydrate ABC transporter permease [Paenibacillus cisolokensis]GIQ65015.1 sugar ABC transporter permease [Paenibacillus cisolokensis]